MSVQKLNEGSATFYAAQGKITKELAVFYNPVMKLNRDIGVLILNSENQKLRVALPLAGSGVRGIRYLKETKNVRHVTFNDLNKKAIKSIKKSIKDNKIGKTKYSISENEGNNFLISSEGFDYIDIDPFGSPNPFLDSSVRRISRRGILAITATDVAALAGTYTNACKRNYWALPMRNELMHEIGIRILIRKAQLVGAQYDKALTPIYSHSSDHYLRVYFRIEKGKAKADSIIKQHKYLEYCNKCLERCVVHEPKGKCSCKNKTIHAGPLWTGELWDKKLAGKIAKETEDKTVQTIAKESKITEVGFHDIHKYCSLLKKEVPQKELILKELRKNKFKASETHFKAEGIRTNANSKQFMKIIKKLS